MNEDAPRMDRFLGLLDLAEVGPDTYRGDHLPGWEGRRVFGGQVAAQALRAALATVPADRPVHSLHAYFILPGSRTEPIDYRVDRVRDGRSFRTRHVAACQGDHVIFEMLSSFHRHEDGPDYQVPTPPAPPPDDATGDVPFGGRLRRVLPFDIRELGPTPPGEGGWPSTRRAWMRASEPLPEDPGLHACILAFVSDMGMVFAARAPVEAGGWDRIMGASVDHAMWFHRPVRADEWFLYDQRAVSNAGARGLAHGTMHTEDGALGATIAQEALLRFTRPG